MKKTVVLLAILGAALVLPGNENGPLPENTNAPGEFTCGRSVCHNIPNNVGPGAVSVLFADSVFTYQPDSVYAVRVRISNPQTVKNGFQILALNQNLSNAGTWVLDDPIKTKVISGISYPNRKYVIHTGAGNQQDEWTMYWKAPSNPPGQGQVTFYASGLASNNNGTNQGDLLYTTTTILSLQPATPVSAPEETRPIVFYPVPARTGFWITAPGRQRITLYSGNGQRLRQQTLEPGENYFLRGNLDAGIYLLCIDDPDGTSIWKKVIFE